MRTDLELATDIMFAEEEASEGVEKMFQLCHEMRKEIKFWRAEKNRYEGMFHKQHDALVGVGDAYNKLLARFKALRTACGDFMENMTENVRDYPWSGHSYHDNIHAPDCPLCLMDKEANLERDQEDNYAK